MSISIDQVKKAAKLVRLNFTEDELNTYRTQLNNIMNMIDTISEIDCSGVEPLTSVCDMNLRVRDDKEEDLVSIDSLFSNAPGKDSDLAKEIKCFVVPKVVE